MPKGAVKVTVKVTGMKESLAAIRAIGGATKRESQAAVKEVLQFFLKETLKVTPKKTGALRRSGKIVMKRAGEISSGDIQFSEPYAVWVHECITDYHAPPTKAKFLETTVRDPRNQAIATNMMKRRLAAAQMKAANKFHTRGGTILRSLPGIKRLPGARF